MMITKKTLLLLNNCAGRESNECANIHFTQRVCVFQFKQQQQNGELCVAIKNKNFNLIL